MKASSDYDLGENNVNNFRTVERDKDLSRDFRS